ncbi:T-complex protein 11-like protein 1 isoform X1 [Apis mellifera caucasica]|uniref:T-complex protein 11-like protein 1 isoform X1 n=1 Tax=Apis mellifera TaxID=7460 RepID=A0A7M7L7Y5_APIME|nr:T-complex protein 11-like protein 1 isoform X1 [Apis mellifera]XP_026297258.1 T-complex protein 11-like protein 1 isoform X1 [Apis mellifera]XP_026297265.1 T-complex protein 11-like protein 1 isoform X1 [Apis mellifera]XP_026297266.1 T-complex protein 11-like protein 1 isoform X1 [Apis mellifera]XP_026297279.1 T-complex protein 11-like protein 1 isoform X1 [Apis mellifera]KAG6798669.1 T-complex protein 11-like protein 1 isoform X1 [Apis mellifera caucasica]KAG9437170.1 T-complex protein 11|eukprot:XP_026297250.1 T-complex protein 11-like protein 1 isoform X1 [Apis mellifera]
MPDRNKVLIGAGVIWGITLCCFFISRKLPGSMALLNFIPGILVWNQKMENDEKQKCNINEASTSVPVDYQSDSHIESEEENVKGQKTANFMASGLIGASPPKFVSLEEIIKAANGMKNMALAHEIAVDKNFQLQKLEPDDGTFHRRVKEIMHKAFWNLLAEQLEEDPPNYTQALVLLKEIKETLDELVLPHHAKIRENLREILDVDLIRQQAENGVLDFHHYAQYVISIMSKVCAPVRDEKIRELNQKTDVIEIFKGIMEILQLMRLDLANFTITMMRPNIVASSIEYEKAKFAEFLKVNTNGLQFTEKWLLRHYDPTKITSNSSDINAVRQLTHCLLTEAYLDLLEWDFNPDAETLMLDQGRLLELRDKTSRLSIIGSIILLVNNTVGAPIHGVSSFKKNIKQHLNVLLDSVHSNKDLETVMPNIVLQVKTDLETTLQEIGSTLLSVEMESLLEGQILDLINPGHKIRHLINLRIRQFLQKIILSQSAAPQQVPPGLSSLQEELTAIVAQFLILISHNRSVFGEYYQEIITNALIKKETENNKDTSAIHTMDL